MLNIKHILAVLDQQITDDPALARALWLAKSLDAELTLITNAWDALGDAGSHVSDDMRGNLREKFTDRAQRWLDESAANLREAGKTVHTQVRWCKHLHDVALEQLATDDYDPELEYELSAVTQDQKADQQLRHGLVYVTPNQDLPIDLSGNDDIWRESNAG